MIKREFISMYFVLTNHIENDRTDAILEGESIYLDRIDCSFRQGISLPVEDIDTPIVFNLSQYILRGTMTDHLSINTIPGPVFSIKAKQIVDKIKVKNIEFLQLKLIDQFLEGKKKEDKTKPIEYNNFFIANVVGLIDCVDHEKSVLEYFYPPELRNPEENMIGDNDENNPFAGENPNEIDFITKLVLDETKIDPALKIFRLKDQPNLLVFHKSIVELIRKENLRGFVFVPVEEYTDVIQDEDEKVGEKIQNPQQKQISIQPKPKEETPPTIQKELTDKKKGRFDSLLNWKEQDK